MNAFPSRRFYFVTRGMLKLIGDDDQRLAGVLAHEIAHVEKNME